MDEPHRQITTLGGYLVIGALAVIGVHAVVATLVIDRRDHLTAFYAVSGVAIASLVFSVLCGLRLRGLFIRRPFERILPKEQVPLANAQAGLLEA